MIEKTTAGISQPIGYVNDFTVYPMSFEEFILGGKFYVWIFAYQRKPV